MSNITITSLADTMPIGTDLIVRGTYDTTYVQGSPQEKETAKKSEVVPKALATLIRCQKQEAGQPWTDADKVFWDQANFNWWAFFRTLNPGGVYRIRAVLQLGLTTRVALRINLTANNALSATCETVPATNIIPTNFHAEGNYSTDTLSGLSVHCKVHLNEEFDKKAVLDEVLTTPPNWFADFTGLKTGPGRQLLTELSDSTNTIIFAGTVKENIEVE